jgi:transcriptional regulator with XRE-family HTH domain
MKQLATIRQEGHLSQRRLAALAGVSFRTVQLLEKGETDPRLSTLSRVFAALGADPRLLEAEIEHLLEDGPDSVHAVSLMIQAEGADSWKSWLFELVDAFRRNPNANLIACPPVAGLDAQIRNLLTATAETLCDEAGLTAPWWCAAVSPLRAPWFVAGLESLKAMALVESPVHFRKRNLFVLSNFLERA